MKVYNKGKRAFQVPVEDAKDGVIKPGVVTEVRDEAASKMIKAYPAELMLFEEARPSVVSKKLQARVDELEKQNLDLAAGKKEAEDKLASSEKSLEDVKKDLEDKSAELADSETELKAVKEELEDANKKIADLEAKVEELSKDKE